MFYTLFTSNTFLPIFCLTFFYGSIFFRIKRAISLGLSQRLNNSSFRERTIIQSPHNETLNDLKQTMKFSKGLFVSFSIYAVALIPFGLIRVIDIEDELPRYFHLYPWLFYRLCSSINPIIYPLFHSSFLYGYRNVLNLITFGKKFNLRKKRSNIKNRPKNFHFKLVLYRNI